MHTGIYYKFKTIGTVLFLLLCEIFHAQVLGPKDYGWPRVMKFYEGRVLDITHDSAGKVVYVDWQGVRIKDMNMPYDERKTKYLYIDSTGKPLSTKLYQGASPFFSGLASVTQFESNLSNGQNNATLVYGHESAIINTREEEVLPMDERMKYPIGKGLAVTSSFLNPRSGVVVYNKLGKKLAECGDCQVGLGIGMDNFWMTPQYSSRPYEGVKLFDLKGKLLYSGSGSSIKQIDNDLPSNGQFRSMSTQAYYRVLKNEYHGLTTILDRNGKVVIDSISMGSFNLGKCEIYKNGLAAVVDTNWNFIVPFSYGYTTIRIPAGHPQGAYFATRNNITTVITSDNKKLIPLESHSGISYNYKQFYYYIAYDVKRHPIYVGLNGDTLVNPETYDIAHDQAYEIPGFFVRSKTNGLEGYVDASGKVVIPCQYDNLFYAGQNLFIFFGHDGSSGYMDLKGNIKFSLRDVSRLSAIHKGYAHCVIYVTDKKKFRVKEKIVTDGATSYQFQERVIDSTGQFVLLETYPPSITELNKTLSDGSEIASFFYKGVALVFNKKTNKYGLVNEKLQVLLPVIYDSIDTKAESFEYHWYSVNGRSQDGGRQGVLPNIINGKVKVRLKGMEKEIDPGL